MVCSNRNYLQKNPTTLVVGSIRYSFSIGGEHATTVNGNGKNPSLSDILAVAENIGLKKEEASNIANQTKEIVENSLSNFLKKKG